MFSGKTSELMKRIKRFKLVGFRCLIIKFAKDIRYSEENLASHDGKEMPAIATLKLMELSNVTVTCDVIGIDEAQFVSICILIDSLNEKIFVRVCNKTQILLT